MGNSADAMLMYGYNLGGDDTGWEIVELDEDGCLDRSRLAWLDDDRTEDAETHLLASVGFAEDDWRAEGYFERKQAAERRVGVTFKNHCSGDSPMLVMSAHTITADWGNAQTIDLTALAQLVVDEGMDAKLAAAITALGMTPKQQSPAWLLCAYWG